MRVSSSHPEIGRKGGWQGSKELYIDGRHRIACESKEQKREPSDERGFMITRIRLSCWIASLAGISRGGLDSGLDLYVSEAIVKCKGKEKKKRANYSMRISTYTTSTYTMSMHTYSPVLTGSFESLLITIVV